MQLKLRTLVSAFLILNSVLAFAQNWDSGKLSGELIERIESGDEGYIPVMITLTDQVDIMGLQRTHQRKDFSRQQRVKSLIETLEAKAAEEQPRLKLVIEGSGQAKPGSVRGLWIANMMAGHLKKELISQLSQFSEIEWIDIDHPIELVGANEAPTMACVRPDDTEPGLLAINAHKLWAMGYTGYGTKALIVDTGTDAEHPSLRNNYLGLYVPDDQAWTGFEPVSRDNGSHGTHVGGTVCGLDRLTNDTIGVAFNALWMASPSITPFNDNPPITSFSAFEAFQWALNPDGNPNTTDDMPDVINNSWGVREPGQGACNSGWVGLFNSMEAAGIAVVFAAGNEGPDPMTLRSPSIVNFDILKSFTVAALSPHSGDYPIADFSSRGPSICSGSGSLAIKPEVAAPGLAIRSALPGAEYGNNSGTSMAAPHVSGAILLLKEAFPQLSGRDFQLALYNTCHDLGEPGEDNTYGMGIIDVYAAFNYLVDQGNTPVDPSVDLDVLMVDMNFKAVSCFAGGLSLDLLFENAGKQEITSVSFEYTMRGTTTFSGNTEWTGSAMPGERVPVSLNIDGLQAGEFVMDVQAVTINGSADEHPLNNTLRKTIILVNEQPLPEPLISEISSSAICDSSEAFIQSDYNGPGKVQWYDEAVDGDLLGEGPSFFTPQLTQSQTIYMDVLLENRLGMESREEGPNRFDDEAKSGLIFDAISPFVLKSVKVYAENSGIRLITLVDFEDNIYAQKIINIPAGEFRIPLNFKVPVRDDLVLQLESGGALSITTSNATFPYEIPGLLQLNRSKATGGSQSRYYYFYDWELEYNYLCGRTPVEVNTIPSVNRPKAGFSQSADEVDLDLSGLVSFTDTSEDAVNWLWDFGTGDVSNEQNPSYTYTEPGTYTVSLTVLNDEGCSDAHTSQVVVTGTITSTTAPRIGFKVNVFPNPARGQVTLAYELEGQANVRISLVDLLGRELKSFETGAKQSHQLQIDTSPFDKGIYFVVFSFGEQQVIKKLVLTP